MLENLCQRRAGRPRLNISGASRQELTTTDPPVPPRGQITKPEEGGAGSSRLLKKGVQVGNIRFRSLKSWSYWRKMCRSHGTFSPFGFADRPFGARRA